MSLSLTAENMKLFFPSWEKPLSNQEIKDFLETPIEEEKRLWYPEWPRNLPRRVWKTPATKKYNTKKEILQDIKAINSRLEHWKVQKRDAPNEITIGFIEACMEELFRNKERLQKRLKYMDSIFKNNNLETARQAPISDFLQFNSAGMAKCPFHTERTNSFHKLPNKEKGHCFGCGRTADVVEVVMELNQCNFKEALKIILKK